jgi:hypothetical protein
MRFDDLLLTEGEYPSGACESRREWLLMYSGGVPAEVIAACCRVTVAKVRRSVAKQILHSPSWFDRCLLVHDQPVPDRSGRFNRPTREGLWWKHYNDVATHVTVHGILPSQNHGDHARVLYRWIEAQRRQNDAGHLTQDKLDALDQLGPWEGRRRPPRTRRATGSASQAPGLARLSPGRAGVQPGGPARQVRALGEGLVWTVVPRRA